MILGLKHIFYYTTNHNIIIPEEEDDDEDDDDGCDLKPAALIYFTKVLRYQIISRDQICHLILQNHIKLHIWRIKTWSFLMEQEF